MIFSMSSNLVLSLIIGIICTHYCVAFTTPRSFEVSDECPANSEQMKCGRACEPSCRRPAPRLCSFNPAHCGYQCTCLSGYVRNEITQKCVKYENCPGTHVSS